MGVGEQGRATGRQDVVRTATRSSATETIYSFTRAANSAKTRREEKDVRKWEFPPPLPPSLLQNDYSVLRKHFLTL